LPDFRRIDNLLTLVQNVSILGILGLAMALIVIGRGVDLSMIAALAIPPALLMQLVNDGYPLVPAVLAALVMSLAFGAMNGWLIAYAEISPLFSTLASGLFLAGLGQAVFFQLETIQLPQDLMVLSNIARASWLGVPSLVWMLGIMLALMALYLRLLVTGAYVYAMGDNPLAARTSGIPTRPMTVLQYTNSSLIASLAGLVLASSLGSLSTRIFNTTLIYDVILVVVLGGIGLSGGRGNVLNVLVGTLLIGTLLNGLTILDVGYTAQNMVKGLVLLLAVVADSLLNPRHEETAQQGDI
jgi:ribose transport system permease protein